MQCSVVADAYPHAKWLKTGVRGKVLLSRGKDPDVITSYKARVSTDMSLYYLAWTWAWIGEYPEYFVCYMAPRPAASVRTERIGFNTGITSEAEAGDRVFVRAAVWEFPWGACGSWNIEKSRLLAWNIRPVARGQFYMTTMRLVRFRMTYFPLSTWSGKSKVKVILSIYLDHIIMVLHHH